VLHYLKYMRVRDAEKAALNSTKVAEIVFKRKAKVELSAPISDVPAPPLPMCSQERRTEPEQKRLCGQGASDMLHWD
jgi:hypothetical protein